jgi:hypothetical protein
LREWPKERKDKFREWPANTASRPDRFSSISFSGAKFRGAADFTGRAAGDGVDFTAARFAQPPLFDSLDRIDLYGAKIGFSSEPVRWLRDQTVRGWTANSAIAVQLRRLRRLAEDSKNHDLERDLYIEERKAERGIYVSRYFAERALFRLGVHLAWIGVMACYWLLADYGRSFLRPLAALVLGIFLFQAGYWYALGPNLPAAFWPRAGAALVRVVQRADTPFARAARAVALANAVPFLGALALDKEAKDTLVCGNHSDEAAKAGTPSCGSIPPLRYQALALSQNVFSLLCAFFIALALRNYFRVK